MCVRLLSRDAVSNVFSCQVLGMYARLLSRDAIGNVLSCEVLALSDAAIYLLVTFVCRTAASNTYAK